MGLWRASDAPTLGIMSRAGLGICALAAVLASLAPSFGEVLRGPDRDGSGVRTATFDGTLVPVAVICAIVLVGAALIPRLWAGFTGIVAGTLITFASAIQVGVARLSKEFVAEADLALLGGGKTLVAAGTIGMAGLIVTLVGVRRDTPVPVPAPERAPGAQPAVASRAVVALAVAVAGILLGLLPPLAIALGVIALAEIQSSGGRLRGQSIAVAAIVIGILTFSLYITLTAIGMVAVTPQA